jgi:hypothetical protein
MLVQFASVLFFSFLVLQGRGFLIFIGKVSKLNFFKSNLNLLPLYGLLSIIFLSNQIFLLNYFFPIKSFLSILIIFNFFIVLQNISIKPNNFKNIFYLAIPLTLSISTFGQNIHPDTDWYGIPYQFLIRNNNLIIGINNVSFPMNQTGILDYLMSVLWLNNNYILFHFVTVSVFSCFFIFLTKSILNSKNNFYFFFSFYIFIFSFLDNFGISGGANGFVKIQMTGKFDSVLAIYIVITFVNLIHLLQKKELLKEDYILLTMFFLFIFQIKTTGLALGLSFLVLNFYYKKFNDISLLKQLKLNLIPILLSILWFLRNLLTMSCLFYPVEFTCLNFSWSNRGFAKEHAQIISEWYQAYEFGENIINWFIAWFDVQKNYQQFGNFLISFTIIFIFFILFINKQFERISYLYCLQIIIGIFLWLVSAPTPRFAFGYFTLLAGIFALHSSSFKSNIFYKKFLIYPLVIISIVLTSRMYSYQEYSQSLLEFPEIKSQIIQNTKEISLQNIGYVKVSNCDNLLICELDFSQYLVTKKFNFILINSS